MKSIERSLLVFSCALFSLAAIAEESIDDEKHGGEEGHSKNTLGLFVGVTHEHGHDLATLGVEYAYRFHENWSVGGVVERADREKNSTLVLAFVHYWPYKQWFIGAGAGRKDPGDERQTTFRATLGYEFEFNGGWVLVPQFNVDAIDQEENEQVYGIAFGKQF
jgi:hypothetical protein